MPDYTHKSNSEYEDDYEDEDYENIGFDLKNRKNPAQVFEERLKARLSGQPFETSVQALLRKQAAQKPDPPLRHRIRGAMSHIDPTQRSDYEPESLYATIATYYDIPQEIEPYQSPSGRYEYRYTNQELIQEIYRDILLLNNIHNQQDHSQYHIGKEILLPTRNYAQYLKAQYQSPEKTQTQTQTAKPETTESLYTKQLEQLKAELNPEERQALDQLLAHKQNLEQTEEKPYDIQNGIPVFDPGKFRNHQEVYQYISLQIQQGDNYFAQHFSIQRLDSPRRQEQRHFFELAGQTYEYVFPAAPKDTPIAAPEKDKPLPEKPSRGLPKDEKDFWEYIAAFFREYGGDLGELSLSTIPIIGEVYDVACAVLGRSLVTDTKLDYTDRFLMLLGVIPLPLVSGKLLSYGKGFVEWLFGKQLIRELFEHYICPAREYIERKWKDIEDYFRGKPKAELDTEQEQKAGMFGAGRKKDKDKPELDKDGTFTDKALEVDYQKYLERKSKQKSGNPARDRLAWKETRDYWLLDSPMARGNNFNKKAIDEEWYDYNEVHLNNGKRVDAYDPIKKEIISRKATNLEDIDINTFEAYLREMKKKYAPGTGINSFKYKKDFEKRGITKLEGKQILEIPESNKNFEDIKKYEEIAKKYGIIIRYKPE